MCWASIAPFNPSLKITLSTVTSTGTKCHHHKHRHRIVSFYYSGFRFPSTAIDYGSFCCNAKCIVQVTIADLGIECTRAYYISGLKRAGWSNFNTVAVKRKETAKRWRKYYISVRKEALFFATACRLISQESTLLSWAVKWQSERRSTLPMLLVFNRPSYGRAVGGYYGCPGFILPHTLVRLSAM